MKKSLEPLAEGSMELNLFDESFSKIKPKKSNTDGGLPFPSSHNRATSFLGSTKSKGGEFRSSELSMRSSTASFAPGVPKSGEFSLRSSTGSLGGGNRWLQR